MHSQLRDNIGAPNQSNLACAIQEFKTRLGRTLYTKDGGVTWQPIHVSYGFQKEEEESKPLYPALTVWLYDVREDPERRRMPNGNPTRLLDETKLFGWKAGESLPITYFLQVSLFVRYNEDMAAIVPQVYAWLPREFGFRGADGGSFTIVRVDESPIIPPSKPQVQMTKTWSFAVYTREVAPTVGPIPTVRELVVEAFSPSDSSSSEIVTSG